MTAYGIDNRPWRQRCRPWCAIATLVAAITVAHYVTSPFESNLHGVFRRLYYLPIVWAAFTGGARPGLLIAGVVALAYLPHAFLLEHHLDPGQTIDKAAELVLYFGLGGLAGWLVDRERRAQRRAQRENLERLAAESDAARLEGLVHLARGLAHEIRNPLGSIQGAIEIIAAALPPERREREMADIGLRETARLNRVLGEFQDFARPRPPAIEPLRASEAVAHVVELLASQATTHEIELTGSAGDDAAMALGDPDQVTQVLVNLVCNALAATPAGGRVAVSAAAETGSDGAPIVSFEVADTGSGVPEELGSSIYDPYVTGRKEGSGLGLPIAATLVKQQGGLLSHRRREGGGTVFRFWLPGQGGG